MNSINLNDNSRDSTLICGSVSAGLFALCLVLCSVDSVAEQITFQFEGYVSQVSPSLESNFAPSAAIYGSYSFESTTLDANPNTDLGHYQPLSALEYLIGGYSGTLGTGSSYIGTVNAHDPIFVNDVYSVYDTSPLGAPVGGLVPSNFFIQLTDSNGTALGDDALPTEPPSLSDFESAVWILFFGDSGDDVVQGFITSLDIRPSDSDGDGLSDELEGDLAAGTGCPSPFDFDSDDDGLSDGQEYALGTNPCNPDTDGDGFHDSHDPLPLIPGATNTFLAIETSQLAGVLRAIDPSKLNGSSQKIKQQRQEILVSSAEAATLDFEQSLSEFAVDDLMALFMKIQITDPPNSSQVKSWLEDAVIALQTSTLLEAARRPKQCVEGTLDTVSDLIEEGYITELDGVAIGVRLQDALAAMDYGDADAAIANILLARDRIEALTSLPDDIKDMLLEQISSCAAMYSQG